MKIFLVRLIFITTLIAILQIPILYFEYDKKTAGILLIFMAVFALGDYLITRYVK